MTTALEAKTNIRQLAKKAQDTVKDDKLTLAEKKTALDKYEAELKENSEIVQLDEQMKRLVGGGESSEEDKPEGDKEAEKKEARKSVGERITDTEAYKSLIGVKGAKFSKSIDLKAVNTINEGTATGADGFLNGLTGAMAIPQYLPGIVDLRFAPLLISQLFDQGTTNSPLISYVKESAWQANAAPVAEGGLKPQSDDSFVRVGEQVGKIADIIKMTDEMMEDIPAAVSFINGRLVFGVQRAEEAQLVSGAGYPGVQGILNRAGRQADLPANGAASPDAVIDAVYAMITTIRTTAFIEPDAAVVNPVDWQHIRLAKDGNGQYYAGGPFTGAYGNGGYTNVDALWGLRVVTTPAIPVGTMLVGGFKQGGQIFRRKGITVEMTNSNEDDFKHDLVAFRAESRLALAVYRPGAFGSVVPAWA